MEKKNQLKKKNQQLKSIINQISYITLIIALTNIFVVLKNLITFPSNQSILVYPQGVMLDRNWEFVLPKQAHVSKGSPNGAGGLGHLL